MNKTILSIFLILFSQVSLAETVHWQGYDIHYTTFRSTLIPAKVAAAHDISRSDRRIVANISIRRDNKAIAARISGTTSNLLSQLFTLDFDEVREPGAIYYLTNLIIDEVDTLRFDLEILPEGAAEPYRLKFTRKYF